jgi:hypothetical protein
MAGIEMKGFEDLKRDVEAFARTVQDEALKEAEDAAAQAIVKMVEIAAPRDSGDLARSVEIVESHDRRQLTGDTRRRLLIGPTKKKGFYGFFLDKGWKHPIGPRITLSTRRGRVFTTGRRARAGYRNTHSRRGVSGYRTIPGTKWFSNLTPRLESAARAAGETAFTNKVNQIVR